MKLSDVLYSLLIIIFFIGCILISLFANGKNNIKDNWELYKCNPAIMPFANYFGKDVSKNAIGCITEMQSGVTAGFMAPFTLLISSLGGIAGGISDQVSAQRGVMSSLSSVVGTKFTNLFSSFFNVLIAFHRFIIEFKDIQMKILGVVTTILYMITGQNLLGQSIVKGPIMKILTTVADGADIITG